MANRYWVGGNTNWDGTAGTKWATTSGGAGGAAVPTNADDVFLDNGAGTGNVTLASGYAAVCKSITCTGYVNTLASADATGSLSVQGVGGITFVAGMTLSCTNLLSVSATMPLTSGGKTWGGAMTISGNVIYTLADAWLVTGTLTTVFNPVINGFSITFAASLTLGAGIIAGTTTLTATGTCTWSGVGTLHNQLTINTGANTFTVSGSVGKITGALIYTSGTTVWTGSTLNVGGGSALTLTLGTQQPNNLTLGFNGTLTLSANLTITGTLTNNNSPVINGFVLYIGGSLNVAAGNMSGTTNLEMNGTGTWSGATGTLQNQLTFNTAGTITVSGTVSKSGGGALIYTAGTMVWTGSTLGIAGSVTLTLGAQQPFNLWSAVSGTITLSANLTITGTYSNLQVGVINGFTLFIGGSLTLTGGSISGTTLLEMNGTGTWSSVSSNVVSNQLTFNTAGTITISGIVYKSAGSLIYIAGTTVWTGSTLTLITTSLTLTLGAQVPFNVTIQSAITITLSADLSITGELKFNASPTLNGFTWKVGGNLNLNASPTTLTGTSGILMNGTGTLISASAFSSIQLQSFVINTAGTITLPTANFIIFGAHATLTTVWTYTAGTIIAGAVKFANRSGVSFTVTAGTNCRFTNLGLGCIAGSSGTTTLGADLYSSGTVSGVSNTITHTMNGYKLYCASMLWDTAGSSVYTGTTDIEFNGSGSNTWGSTYGVTFRHNIIFNMAGSLVISGGATGIAYNTGTITFTAGTVSHTGTLLVTGTCTFNTNGMSWNNFTISGTPTITINSLLTLTGTMTTSTTTTFAGTSGWTVANWTCITAGVTVTFANGKTYTLLNGNMTNVGTAASKILFTSDHAVTKAILTLVGVTEANVYLSGTRMDSSLGATVWTVGGVLTSTINWNLLTAPGTVAYSFVN